MKSFLVITLLFSGFPGVSADTRTIPSFPGAEGFGAFTPGGRGGKVHFVSNLHDSGPGSLRAACDAPGARIVILGVSGTIELKSDLRIRSPFLTIAGQTAPGDGICLKNFACTISTHDVVVRHLRFRPGDLMRRETDALSLNTGARNVIIDHCSASWSVDEVLSVSGTNINNITVQWCLIAESLNQSHHRQGAHGYGSLLRADGDITFHHNIYAHHNSRNPRPGSYGTGRGILLDFRNNLIYDWGAKAGYSADDPASLNYIGNHLKPGPSTRDTGIAFTVGGPATRIFVSDNYLTDGNDGNADNWKMIAKAKSENRMENAFPVAPVDTDHGAEILKKLLDRAGATLPLRDAADRRIIAQIKDGKGRITNTQSEAGSWPELKSAPALRDTDEDGIPDVWEVKHGLNPRDPADGNQDRDGDGYTNLEEFLNSI